MPVGGREEAERCPRPNAAPHLWSDPPTTRGVPPIHPPVLRPNCPALMPVSPQPPSSQYPFYTKKTEFEAEPPKSFGVFTLFKEKDFVDLPEAEYLTGNVSLFHEEQWRQQGGFKKKSRGERQIFSFSQITRYFYALLIVLQKLCYVMLCSIYLHLSILYYTTRQMYSIVW